MNDYMYLSDAESKKEYKQLIKEIKDAFVTTYSNDKIKGLAKARGKYENLLRVDIFGKPLGTKTEIVKAKKELEEPVITEGFTKLIIKKVSDIKWNGEFVNKALFLDIDGTLRKTEHLPYKYPTDVTQVELLFDTEKIRDRLDEYIADGYQLIGVSNQSGITKGTITEEVAKECFSRVRELLGYSEQEFPINYCPHRAAPITCFCRKPQSGMGVDAIMKYKLNPEECLMVGDMTSDTTFATRLRIPFITATDFWN